MSKSLGNYVGVHRAARGGVRQAHAGARHRHAGLLRPPARRAARPGACRRATRSARSPAPSPRASTAPRRAATAEAHFDRLHVERGVPDDVEEHAFSSDNGTVHLPALLARRLRPVALGGAPAAGPGRREARRGAARRATPWTFRPPGWTAPCSRSGAGAVQAAPAALERRCRELGREPASAVLHCSVALGTVWNHPTDRARGL